MTEPFQSIIEYELYIYSLKEKYSEIQESNLVLIRKGATLAVVVGEIIFKSGFQLRVRERLEFDRLPLKITSYGYEILKDNQKLFWYDSQPHPDDDSLQLNHPHHKHIQPNIKTNRIPAPNLSFDKVNLDFLIKEINQLI